MVKCIVGETGTFPVTQFSWNMSKKALRNPVWNRNREDGVYFGMNYRVVLAQHAAARSAAKVHREMGRGLCGLATVAATAPFVGMIGTVLGIINSFPGVTGERSAIMAAIAQRLSDSMMPTALGVALSVAALCGYRYFSAQIADFNSEIRNAILDLSNHLLVSRRM